MSSLSISGGRPSGGASGIAGLRPPPPPPGGPGGGTAVAEATSDVLGLSAEEITSALQEGKSLNDLAESQGVSHDELIAALRAGMPDDLAAQSGVDDLLEAVAAQSGVQGPSGVQGLPPGGGFGSSGGVGGYGSAARVGSLDGAVSGVFGSSVTSTQQEALDSLGDLLGTDTSSLIDTLRSGTSLADLVRDAGLDSGTLADVIQNGLLFDIRS